MTMNLPPPPRHEGVLTPGQQRAIVAATVATHVAAGWGLLQIDAVRQVVAEAVPIFVSFDQPPPAPTPPPPVPQPRTPPPKIPLIAAAPQPTAAPPVFVAEPAPPLSPEPVVMAPVPPAPPAPPAPPPPIKSVPPSAVRYISVPKLNFPLASRRAREQGTVVLRITVDVNGRLKSARVHKSSGFERLDQQALQDIRSAHFAPQTEDGKPVEWETLAPLGYDL